MIPKKIFQIWIGPKKPPTEWMQTWKDMNPTWEYNIITNDNIPEIKNRKQFDMMEELAGKADILRVELLYNHGGIFIDADSICTNPLDDALLNNNNFACYENEQCRKGLIANGYLGAEKGSRLMELMIKKILEIESFEGKMAWQSTGPCLLTESNRELPYNLTIYPSYYFLPKHYTGLEYKGDCKSYSEQYWGSTFNLYK